MSFIYNGRMFGEIQNLKDKGLKDSSSQSSLSIKDTTSSLSYNKTNKLIAGLYMVTDILDKDEPIRFRLRFLGTGVISDISIFPSSINALDMKIAEILSFLNIASTVGLMSQMNSSILKKEFLLLQESIEESRPRSFAFNGVDTLEEFMKEKSGVSIERITPPYGHSIGHIKINRIGVQKGHTLMKALSDKASSMSDTKHTRINGENFENLKKERRGEIIKIIRKNSSGATIKDIRAQSQGALITCGEKTLQRELISMVKDHVLNKTGEKRWSRYFVSI